MNINKKNARLIGLLYIISTFPMAFTELYVRSKLIVWDNPLMTANNIMAEKSLYTIGFVCDVIGTALFALVPIALFRLLQSVNRECAVLMVLFALISVPIMAINMQNHATVLDILQNQSLLNAFGSEQLNSLMMISLEAHGTGYLIAQIFFGLWLLPLGILVYQSKFLPKLLGVLLIIACFGYLVQFITIFLFPNYISVVNPIVNSFAGVGELGFMFWLLIRGLNESKIVDNNQITRINGNQQIT